MGFDIVYFGNAKEIFEKTVIVERRSETLRNAKVLKKAIGCSFLKFDLDPDDIIDVTLILGKDYKKFFGNIEKEQIIF